MLYAARRIVTEFITEDKVDFVTFCKKKKTGSRFREPAYFFELLIGFGSTAHSLMILRL